MFCQRGHYLRHSKRFTWWWPNIFLIQLIFKKQLAITVIEEKTSDNYDDLLYNCINYSLNRVPIYPIYILYLFWSDIWNKFYHKNALFCQRCHSLRLSKRYSWWPNIFLEQLLFVKQLVPRSKGETATSDIHVDLLYNSIN